jgi:hypothetical protein
VRIVHRELPAVGEPKGIVPALLLEARQVGPTLEEVAVRSVQILERLLERVDRRPSQESQLGRMPPRRELPAQGGVAEVLLPALDPLFLQRQRAIEYEPATARDTDHLPRDRRRGLEAEAVSLQQHHGRTIRPRYDGLSCCGVPLDDPRLTRPATPTERASSVLPSAGCDWEWARQVSNLRPSACQADALPLSYAPVLDGEARL